MYDRYLDIDMQIEGDDGYIEEQIRYERDDDDRFIEIDNRQHKIFG